MEFFRDWEEIEEFNINNPELSTCSTAKKIGVGRNIKTSSPPVSKKSTASASISFEDEDEAGSY